MRGLFIILASYLAGEILSDLIGNFIPGSVLGMLVLFGLLQFRAVKKEDVRPVARMFLDNMMLFFVPICVGLMGASDLIKGNVLAIVATVIATTILVIVVVGLLQQRFENRLKR